MNYQNAVHGNPQNEVGVKTNPSATTRTSGVSGCELDAPHMSIGALAMLYCHEPASAIHHEDLIAGARVMLGKYDLSEEQLDDAAPILARTMQMRVEQNGGLPLSASLLTDLEHQVLEWCGYLTPEESYMTGY